MKLLHELATQLLLGSERRPPTLPETPGELGAFLQALAQPGDDREIGLLRQAGSLAVCAAAGYAPAAAATPPLPACPPEPTAVADDRQLVATLQQILADGPDALRREAFSRLASRATCLAPELLVPTLTLGQKNRDLRPSLLAVLGERGRWLAALNPDWSYAAGTAEAAADPSLWEEGSQEQRKQLLGSLRQSDPDRARCLLQEGFAQLEARERASLLETMGYGLGPSDEDFLENLLVDRSKEVRQRAASLLAALPDSRYSQRMAQRMAACLGAERKLFRTVRTLEAPAAFAADWKNDALEESRPKSESLGERAWWLYQIARGLPLGWWEKQTGLSPAELIKWVRATDWSEAILRAWHEALLRQPAAAWAGEFLSHGGSWGIEIDVFALLAFLPAREREQYWLSLLKEKSPGHTRGWVLARLVEDFSRGQEPPSADFSQRVLAEVRQLLNQPTYITSGIYEIGQALPEFVCLIPPSCFAAACENWPAGPAAEHFSKTLARILTIVEQRKILHQILR